MKLTQEQTDIINTTGNIKINAVAGSGKTTTIIEYARSRPKNKKILYLAFNRSVKLEATKKFAEKGLDNVRIETAHSLAFRNIVTPNQYKVRNLGYRTNEIAELLKLKGNGEKHTEYIVANHINKFITYFCNSNANTIQELNYPETVSDNSAKAFVLKYKDYILRKAELLLKKMDKGEIEITHDFYLKKYQLSKPELQFDYILFDEGQDASAAMLDIFFRQKATKVIVGDTHQQIYGWRFAVNSLRKADFKSYLLSSSFRFSQDIANLAMKVLDFKKSQEDYQAIQITGKGISKDCKTKAVLARTNLGLLLKAIEFVTEKKEVRQLYFEGSIHSYTYADSGTSLYDILNLYNGKRALIRDRMIGSMRDLRELEEFIEKTEDAQLGMMVDIVKAHGNSIPSILKELKARHVKDDEKDKAEIIFSTVHRCKGMEYDTVELVNDFVTEEKLKRQNTSVRDECILQKLNEEINLLYVAVTRAKHTIHLPEVLLPSGFPVSPHINIIRTRPVELASEPGMYVNRQGSVMKESLLKKDRTYSVEEIREKHLSAYRPWTEELDLQLELMYRKGSNIRDLMKHFGRTRGAITSRIKKLECNSEN